MITVKIGGSIFNDLSPSTIPDLKNLFSKERLILVHGGGSEVTAIAVRLGKEQKFVVSPGGIKSRVTDKETAEIYTMVMSGKINKAIVKMFLQHGIKAVGISGVDGGLLRASRKKKLTILNDKGRKMTIEGGFTGRINTVDSTLLNILAGSGFLPVVSPIALGEEFEFLNVDGDRAAAYIAAGTGADKVIFLTNVEGLILGGNLVAHLTLDQAKSIIPKIGFGMEKKVFACTEAIQMGVKEAIIGSGTVNDPVSSALTHNNCTVISKT
ncbi:MAG TPA: [LysW]-aminoadipate/[LysW]-glutamate kinase [Nitrososphaeraceae archaeon]|nr:[LysW]-aminoadipate/[LysW]-glutamate kinase [Nitrososphaeraceae archaeon]